MTADERRSAWALDPVIDLALNPGSPDLRLNLEWAKEWLRVIGQ